MNFRIYFCILAIFLFFCSTEQLVAFADGLPERGIIRLANKGAMIHRYTAPDWVPLNKDTVVVAGDSLRTAIEGRIVCYLDNRVMIAMKPKSIFQFLPEKKGLSSIRLFQGSVYVIAKDMNNQSFSVITDSGTVETKGGKIIANTTKGQNSLFYCLDGQADTYVTGREENRGQLLAGRLRSFAVGEPQLNRSIPINILAEEKDWRNYLHYFKEFKRIEDNYNFSLYKNVVDEETNIDLINFRISYLKLEDLQIDFYDQDRYLHYVIPHHLRVINGGKYQIRGKILPPAPEKKFIYQIDNKRYRFEVDKKGEFKIIALLPTGKHTLQFFQQNGNYFERIKKYSLKILSPQVENEDVKDYFKKFGHGLQTRNIFSLKELISADYRDKFGADYFEFTRSIDEAFRETDDLFLEIRPQKISYPYGKIYVNAIVVFSYIDRISKHRLIDRYLDTFTLVRKGDSYQMLSKERGIFFSHFDNFFENSGGIVQGTILDEARNIPIQGADVEVLGTNFKTTTDALGKYRIAGIPPGTYNVRISKAGFAQQTISNVRVFQASSPTGFNLGPQVTFDGGDKGFR